MRDVSTSGQCWQLSGSTLGYLRGSWHAERTVSDHRAGRDGWFTGQACFRPAPAVLPPGQPGADDLTYCEHGELRFGGHRGPASRSLIYRPATGGAAEVMFADGRPFYLLDLHSGCWQARHPCGSDLYLVTVLVTGADSFTEQWRASGPGKDYEMTTTMTRIGTRE